MKNSARLTTLFLMGMISLLSMITKADSNGMLETPEITAKRTEMHRLHMAIRSGDKAEIDKFLKSGVDINQTAAMRLAIVMDRGDIVDLLLENGADINGPDIGGDLPAEIALQHGRLKIMEHLVNKGANINLHDRREKSLLEKARSHGKPEMVEFLMMHGATQ